MSSLVIRSTLLSFGLGLALLYVLTFTLPAQAQDPVAVTVEFEESTYAVAESDDSTTTEVTENEVEVTVTLSADPLRTVTIPITTTNEGGATSSDYSGVPTSVTFDSGETEQTFTFTATADTVDDDLEKVKLSFGTLPAAVTAGTRLETTVTITDDDDPQVTVSFRLAAYTVNEGFSVQVDIDLSGDPERNLLIPLTRTFLGGAIEADLDAPSTAVHVVDGSVEGAISFRTEQDTVADHGESVRLGFGTLPAGVTASGTTTTTVTIIDDDPAVTVTFGALADLDYTIAEGEQVIVPVELSAAPQRPLSIPITFTYMGGGTADDHMCTGAPAVFTATQTTHNMTCTIVQDTIPDSGEIIQTNFGTLPPGVILGPGEDRTVQIVVVDDDPAVTVRFDEATYDVAEGDNVDVTVTLSADPQRLLTIPISAASAGSTTRGRLRLRPTCSRQVRRRGDVQNVHLHDHRKHHGRPREGAGPQLWVGPAPGRDPGLHQPYDHCHHHRRRPGGYRQLSRRHVRCH